jgi:hypothetical protein
MIGTYISLRFSINGSQAFAIKHGIVICIVLLIWCLVNAQYAIDEGKYETT